MVFARDKIIGLSFAMAITREVAPDALTYSDQECDALSTSNSNFAALASELSYLDTKDQCKWFGNFKALLCLVKILLETNDTGANSQKTRPIRNSL